MIINIVIGIAIVVVLFVIIVSLQPADFRISRSASVSAPPQAVFAQVNDFHKWEAWSPWAKMDPSAKNTFTGPDAGVGAGFGWSGNNKVGEGMMTITESRPGELVRIKLEFLKPMKATHAAEFAFKLENGSTTVSWTMSGKNNFMGKAFNLFVNCDRMVGGQFEQGLSAMKALAESVPAR